MKAGITYAPELIGENPRLIAEREFLKLQAVIAELADRLERVASIVSDQGDLLAQQGQSIGQIDATNAEQNSRLDEIEDLVDKHEGRLEALENPE